MYTTINSIIISSTCIIIISSIIIYEITIEVYKIITSDQESVEASTYACTLINGQS